MSPPAQPASRTNRLIGVWAVAAALAFGLRDHEIGGWLLLAQLGISLVIGLRAMFVHSPPDRRWPGCLVFVVAAALLIFVLFERVRFG
jgi:hypothetical protein